MLPGLQPREPRAPADDLRPPGRARVCGRCLLLGREATVEESAAHAQRCWDYVCSLPERIELQTRKVRKRNKQCRCSDEASTSSGAPKQQNRRQKKQEVASKTLRNESDYEVKPLRFHRMVMTDGYNLSVLLTTADDARGKVLGSRKRSRHFFSNGNSTRHHGHRHRVNRGPCRVLVESV